MESQKLPAIIYDSRTFIKSCLIVTTYKKQVDKIKLLKQQASFVSKMNIAFLLKNRYFPRKFAESDAKGIQTSSQRCSSVEIWHFVVYDIYDNICIY